MSYKGAPAKRGPSGKNSRHSSDKRGDSSDDREELKYSANKMLKQIDMSQLHPRNLQADKIVQVATLTDKSHRWKIRVKVKSKSKKKMSRNGEEYFEMVLADKSGTINALAFKRQNVEKFFDKFQEKKKYFFSRGKLKKVHKTISNTQGYQIRLTPETSVTLCNDVASQSRAGNTKTQPLKNAVTHDIVEKRKDSAMKIPKRKPSKDRNWGLKRTELNAIRGRKRPAQKWHSLPVIQAQSDSDDGELEQQLSQPFPSTYKRPKLTSRDSKGSKMSCTDTPSKRGSSGKSKKCTKGEGKLLDSATKRLKQKFVISRGKLQKVHKTNLNAREREDSAISTPKRKPSKDMHWGLERTEEDATRTKKRPAQKCLPVIYAQSDSDDGESDQQLSQQFPSTTKRPKLTSRDSKGSKMPCTGTPCKRGSTGKSKKRTKDEGKVLDSALKRLKQSDEEEKGEEKDDNVDFKKSHLKKRKGCIPKLRAFIQDHDRTKQLLQRWISSMVSMASGNSHKAENLRAVQAKGELEDRLDVAMQVCQSQDWTGIVLKDIKKYPVFVDGITHDKCPKGDIEMLEKCQVCSREYPWWIIVTLKGKPYWRETFEEREDVEDKDKKYFMGKYCHQRIKLFHDLCHFGYDLYEKCKYNKLGVGKTKKAIDFQKSLLNEMYRKLTNLFEKVEKDYTTKGNARVNNQWKKDHDSKQYS